MSKIEGHKVSKAIKIIITIAVIAVAYYFIANSPWVQGYLNDPQKIKDFALGFGAIAPVILILFQAIQNILPLLPHEITAVATGFIFGSFLGSVYTLIGAFLGSLVVFVIARKYGKKLAEKVFNKKEIVHFHLMFKKNPSWAVFIARVIPLFPNDLVSFAAGLTEMNLLWFNISSTLGFVLEVVILSYFGASLSEGISLVPVVILVIFFGISALIVTFKHQIKTFLVKDIKKLEKEGRNLEKEVEKEFKKI